MHGAELFAIGRKAGDVVARQHLRHLAHLLFLLRLDPAQDAIAGQHAVQPPGLGQPRKIVGQRAGNVARPGQCQYHALVYGGKEHQIGSVLDPLDRAHVIAPARPHHQRVGGEGEGSSWPGGLPSSRAYSMAAGAALISCT